MNCLNVGYKAFLDSTLATAPEKCDLEKQCGGG